MITLFLSREEPPTSIVDVSVPESTDLPVKTEQLDPLGKSLSECGGSEGDREGRENEAADEGLDNVSSLLESSWGSHKDNTTEETGEVADILDVGQPRGLCKTMETGGVPEATQPAVEAGEVEVILIESDSDDDAEDVELSTEEVVKAIKKEPISDSEAGAGVKEPKEPDAPEEFGSDQDTYDSDSSQDSGLSEDAKNANDAESDDGGGVGKLPEAMNEEEHGGGDGADEAGGGSKVKENFGWSWLEEMAVGPGDRLFYDYMVSCRKEIYSRGFMVFLFRLMLVLGS